MKPYVAARIAAQQRAAHRGSCAGCGAGILYGPDGDVAAYDVVVDVAPVTVLDELVALLAGRQSYDVVHGDLNHRDSWRACAERRFPIHLEHICPKGAV